MLATAGTAQVLRRNGVAATVVGKYSRGAGSTSSTRILAGDVDLVVNTPFGRQRPAPRRLRDPHRLRWPRGVPCITTVQGVAAAVQGIEALRPR